MPARDRGTMWSAVVATTVQPGSRSWQRPPSRSITRRFARSNAPLKPRRWRGIPRWLRLETGACSGQRRSAWRARQPGSMHSERGAHGIRVPTLSCRGLAAYYPKPWVQQRARGIPRIVGAHRALVASPQPNAPTDSLAAGLSDPGRLPGRGRIRDTSRADANTSRADKSASDRSARYRCRTDRGRSDCHGWDRVPRHPGEPMSRRRASRARRRGGEWLDGDSHLDQQRNAVSAGKLPLRSRPEFPVPDAAVGWPVAGERTRPRRWYNAYRCARAASVNRTPTVLGPATVIRS